MPLRKFAADALGVVTISLVAVLAILGLLCILHSLYFRSRTRRHGFDRLRYFAGPWVIRIIFIVLAILWGFGEVARLSFWREEGRVLDALNLKWQEILCKCYVVSNLGFVEPCLFLTLLFLLRASLQTTECRILSRQWNGRTAGYVLLGGLPVFALQLFVILIGPELNRHSHNSKWPLYFTKAFREVKDNDNSIALCTYPLLSTILLGLFATVLTSYLACLGRKILKLVINKCLKKRVYTLVVSVSTMLPLRVILVGLSVLLKPEQVLFEALTFLAFLAVLCCIGICILVLVYFPCADSLALGNIEDLEDQNDTVSLIATNRSHREENTGNSPGRDSASSSKRGSISFRTLDKDGTSAGTFVELSLFSPNRDDTPPGSPPFLGWPMRSPPQQLPQPSDP